MQIDWHSSQNPFEAGIALDLDHSEMLLLIKEVTDGATFLANLLDSGLKGKDFPAALRVLLVEAVRGVFSTQTQRILDNDKGNGVLIVMPWQWMAMGFFWFFEIRTRFVYASQDDWRWCSKCQGLFFSGGQAAVGSCPAGGQHEKGGSGNYALRHNESTAPGQQDWRWCSKCQGLFFSGGQAAVGSCPAGGQHEKGVSGNYALIYNEPTAPGQQDWRWCSKCQGLFFSGGQVLNGSCPAHGQHEKGVSANYTPMHAPV